MAIRALGWLIVIGLFLAGCSRQSAETSVSTASATPARYATLDALPDWTGVWSADTFKTIVPGVMASSGNDAVKALIPPELASWGGYAPVPLTAKYQALRAKQTFSDDGIPVGNNMAKCLPSGMPGIMRHGIMFEFLYSPGRVTMVFEDGEVRRIYTDGRPHPPADELYVNWTGHSIGHWEDKVLVVDTIGMIPKAELFNSGTLRVTRNTHIVERMWRENADTFRIDTTITDPEIFTTPYSYPGVYKPNNIPMPDAGCLANNRDSETEIDLTPPDLRP
jgi:hypothetical protein